MLVLKGNAGKSILISHISASIKSLIVQYYDEYIPYGTSAVTIQYPTKECKLREAIDDAIENYINDSKYDYFIVYTNLKENDEQFQEVKKYLEDQERILSCRLIVMTCMEGD